MNPQGSEQHRERLAVAEGYGYDAAICTVVAGNMREKGILIDNGWTAVFSFKNRETGNQIEVWMRGLGDNDFRYPMNPKGQDNG